MALPLFLLATSALGVGAFWAKKRRDDQSKISGDGDGYGVMTPQRQAAYETAFNEAKDADKIEAVADEFERAGLKAQAILLRKKAALRRLPPDVQAARKAAFRAGMKSTKKLAVIDLAKAFQEQGCPGAAKALLEYATGLPDSST